MSDASRPSDDSLPLSLERQIDAICLRFEADWHAGRQPRVEPYLDEAPPEAQAALLRELLALELPYRRSALTTRCRSAAGTTQNCMTVERN